MKTLVLATAAFGLITASTPAFAETAVAGTAQHRTQEISVAGLDLDTAEGQRLLDERVERAAREVCGFNEARVGTRIRSNDARQCAAQVRASAKRQVATIMEDQRRGG